LTVYSWWVPGLVLFAMYLIGLVLAPLVAWVLKSTLLRGETPLFVMEMPVYKWPAFKTVVWRMLDAAGAFLRRAGTIILATMILVWALLYFPRGISNPDTAREGLAQAAAVLQPREDGKEDETRKALAEEVTALRDRLDAGSPTYDDVV